MVKTLISALPYVDLKSKTVLVDYQVSLDWFDSRLIFTDLHNMSELNTLQPLRKGLIWKPRLIFLNSLGQDGEETFSDQALVYLSRREASRNDHDIGLVKDDLKSLRLQLPRESRLFPGGNNSLSLQKKLSQNFPCDFDLFYYPFDAQVPSTVTKHK